MMKFDIFRLRQFSNGWVVEVDIARPINAPKHRYTKADRQRKMAAIKINYEQGLYMQLFPTLNEAMEKIRELCHEEAKST